MTIPGLTALGSAIAVVAVLASGAPAAAAPFRETIYCKTNMHRAFAPYSRKRAQLLQGCAAKLQKCELQSEIAGDNPTSCRLHALDSCTTKLGPDPDSKLNGLIAKSEAKATAYCELVGIADMLATGPGGLWYGNDPLCGSAADVPTLVQCVRSRLDLEVDATVSDVAPRAGLLLDNIGLGAGFPNLTRPPLQPLVVAATAPGSGTLVPPGTVNLPVGTALRITGDGATLPCAPGSNGRLIVTVGSQTLELAEPYTADITLGPFIQSGNVPYTVELKDGPCMDTAADNVSVP